MSETETDEVDTSKLAKIGSSKMTAQVGKLMRQAEAAPEGSPEREAFMEKAFDLAAAYTIDIELAKAAQAKKEGVQVPEEIQYQVGTRSGGSRANTANGHMAELMIAIGKAYDMKALISNDSVYVWLTGLPDDHAVVERMYALLSIQMVSEADARLKRGEHKTVRRVALKRREKIPEDERQWGEEIDDSIWLGPYYAEDESMVGTWNSYYAPVAGRHVDYVMKAPPSHRDVPVLDDDGQQVYEEKLVSEVDGRIWRKNFYDGFIDRTKSRLREAKRQAMKAAGIDPEDASDSKALVMADKAERIEDHFEKVVLSAHGKVGTWKGKSKTETHWGGREHGEQAAEKARLGDEKDLGQGD